MSGVTIAEAKAHLSELVERAARGATVRLTRRGKVIAKIAPLEEPRKPVDVAALRALTDRMPLQTEPSSEFVRRMRNEDRY
ncbi:MULTISPECIES: type II toxin-antitoxin system Phd/YefM family antitoxin [Methylosinus]|uniref:Antitoxin n=1 Tax=Methylosinus trichosporium (strain ATCC 35070 / NCIMB 11131 / UNIQEM 75 / OB3b) TaxID=595536 RepID=A0A2D2D673_METT3|nr:MULTISPECIES: type II toxin-antitoxin system prevent-host-death family antitoxin [Methylosinus]ATQ70517.1 type II toxin-antitoxin system prevent-host-death family antitoxin [Methylosinus trichosporium OB3b]OBS53908.1 prevent-host-death protein [Methylosinus sp. 3S-1]